MAKLNPSEIKPQKILVQETEEKKLDELKQKYGNKKILPRGYELQALVALSHYPELIDIEIEFVFKESNLPLQTKPLSYTVPMPAKKRKYQVVISKKCKSCMEPTLLRNLNFNMQVGVIAHELGHVADYIKKNAFEIIKDGVLYILNSHKRHLEKRTDRITIKHGFGYQILEYCLYVNSLKDKYPDEKYYRDYNKYYMSPGEIEAKMHKLKLYEK